MSRRLDSFVVELGEDLEEKLRTVFPDLQSFRVLKQSIDARHKRPKWVYHVEIFEAGDTPSTESFDLERIKKPSNERPIVIGAGPAGLFCALRLVERGQPCILLERGSKTTQRLQKIARYWRYGELDLDTNACFGEGGAGLYSDGKLITRIKSPHIPYIMDRLIRFGAPEEIRYLSNPHLGSDKMRKILTPLREFLISEGCEMHFDAPVDRLLITNQAVSGVRFRDGRELKSSFVVVCVGHSATDFLKTLREQGVAMEAKDFALGLRVEHPQEEINRIQYGSYWDHPDLGSAAYKLTDHDPKTGVGVYSFCMCPGGYVLSTSTEAGHLVTNGMSNYHRGSGFANAGIVISVSAKKYFPGDLWGGFEFRSAIERRVFEFSKQRASGREIPAQRLVDFLERRETSAAVPMRSSSPSHIVSSPLHTLFETEIYQRLCSSFHRMNQKMQRFISPNAVLHAVESRTSCPIRMPRDPKHFQSLSHRGLYPGGEGAGYAGGITSAAVDGVRIADALLAEIVS